MEDLHSKTKEASKKYLTKYKDLVKMITGYESIDKDKDMKKVKGMTSKIKNIIDKTLISEDEFSKLKKEQSEIMEEHGKLEKMRLGSPFSKDSVTFSKTGTLPKSTDSGIGNETKQKDDTKVKPEEKIKIKGFKEKYSSDISSLLKTFKKIEKVEEKEVINCSSENDITIEDLALANQQKLGCDGTINQYYKMPNINIQITNGEDKTVTVKPQIGKTMKVKTVHKKVSKRKHRTSASGSLKKKGNSKRPSKKVKKCQDDKLNNHKVF